MDNNLQETKGMVFDIQRYSVHDGPGIRTLVFTKGCPLQCLWCANPEGLDIRRDIFSEPDKCIGCGKCMEACKSSAISLDSEMGFIIDRNLCVRCGDCAEVCPSGSKSAVGKTMTAGEIVKIVKREMVFYKSSGGGITMGGGEILMQPAFVYAVLKLCHQEGIHTAIETCAMGQWAWLEKIVSLSDTIHMDLKAVNPQKHKSMTGADNRLILDNIKKTDEALGRPEFSDKSFIIRIPVIPGMNDSSESAAEAAEFLSQLHHVSWVELLPFHNFGERKYAKLNMKYEFEGKPNCRQEALEPLRDILASSNKEVRIGKI